MTTQSTVAVPTDDEKVRWEECKRDVADLNDENERMVEEIQRIVRESGRLIDERQWLIGEGDAEGPHD